MTHLALKFEHKPNREKKTEELGHNNIHKV